MDCDDDHAGQHLPLDPLAGDRVNDLGYPFLAARVFVLRLSGEAKTSRITAAKTARSMEQS